MSRPPERIERESVKDRAQNQTVIVLTRPAGFFAKLVGLVAALLLLAVAFVFSLIFLAILAAAVLVFLAYVWWASRRTRKPAGR